MIDIVERLKDAEIATHALFAHIFQHAREEIERLRSKVEAMEKQEPAAWMDKNGTLYNTVSHVRASDRPLYLAPGAQPAPIVPEGWKLVPIEPTYEMLEAGEGAFVTTYTDTPVSVPFDVYRAMLAAAPESKPCP